MDSKIYGPNKELNDKARDKFFKCYSGNGFIIKIPVDPKNFPDEELKYLESKKKSL